MNHIAPPHEPLIRELPLSRLALAPENVRKTPADPVAEAEMKASIATHGLAGEPGRPHGRTGRCRRLRRDRRRTPASRP